MSQQDLSAEQRRRNVERMLQLEGELGRAHQQLGLAIFNAAQVYREMDFARRVLREVFGLPPLPPVAPLYAGLVARADEELREEPNGD